jgi:Subtilase family
MTDVDNQSNGRSGRRPTVSDVVELSDRGSGFAYRPGEVLVRGSAEGRLRELTRLSEENVQPVSRREEGRGERGWWLATGVDRPLDAIDVLVAEGFDAQPNNVMFVHGCGPPCPPHPAVVQQLVRSGLLAHPMGANPMGANPMGANPMGANPMGANHPMENSAVPVDAQRFEERELSGPGPHPYVVVLDTGLAGGTEPVPDTGFAGETPESAGAASVDHTPPFLVAAMSLATGALPRINGTPDLPDVDINLPSGTAPADHYLDPAAGHGTFIAGIIEQLAPGCTIKVRKVIGPLGDAIETVVASEIHAVVDDETLPRPLILSISFGGQALDPPGYLREAVARAVAAGIPIIASAGNDGLCTPQYPAAFPGVIAVAALGPDGPPPWTNYGDWVDACAPGTDLVSTFFDRFDGAFPTVNSYDPDRFSGWAEWSGTSFAVPVVVAAVARELVCGRRPDGGDLDAVTAVERVVRAPHLARLPCLGTVVNI